MTHNEFYTAVSAAKNSPELDTTIENYIIECAREWWKALRPTEREAVVLLNFNPSVVSSMMFFGDTPHRFVDNYDTIKRALYHKSANLAATKSDDFRYHFNEWLCDMVNLQHDGEAYQNEALETAQTVAATLDLSKDAVYALRVLLARESGKVKQARKNLHKAASEYRHEFLRVAMNYLKYHYKDIMGE
jgi:hypothetical protein